MMRIYLIGFLTLCFKEAHRLFRVWVQTLIPPCITMSLYFLIFGTLLGHRVGTMQGLPFLQFIAPGLVMMAAITNAYTNTSFSLFSSKFQRSIEEILISPLPNTAVVLGFCFGGVLRGVLVALVVILCGEFFTHFHLAHPLLAIGMVLLATFSFSLAGFLNALYSKSFDDVSIVPAFVLTPLAYLGGIFYPLDQLHGMWSTLARLNPIAYLVEGLRYACFGVGPWHAEKTLWIMCGLSIILLFLNRRLLSKHGVI